MSFHAVDVYLYNLICVVRINYPNMIHLHSDDVMIFCYANWCLETIPDIQCSFQTNMIFFLKKSYI